MTLPAFPLSAILRRTDWQMSPIPEVAATDFDQGPARRRRRFTSLRYQMSGRLVLTADEFGVFKGFYFGTLQHGALKFTMTIWDGEACTLATVRFDRDQPYIASQFAPGRVQVSLKLEVFDLPVFDAGTMSFLAGYTSDEAISWDAALHLWVNTTYPAAVDPYSY